MIKKILLWSLFAAFAAILVVGAINRTNVKSTDAAHANGGNGQGQDEHIEFTGDHENEVQGFQGNRQNDDAYCRADQKIARPIVCFGLSFGRWCG